MKSNTRFVMVGGFLGAGKTTLLAKATERLVARGMRVGLITNDQATNLVDTAILDETGSPVQEVSGGCFCCRFQDLVDAADKLLCQSQPDILLGEPVGSCTDLSATVLQPIKQSHGDRFRMAPFSVLVDVKQVRTLDRIRQSLASDARPRFPENVMYIYRKQLEEADLIVLNKTDLLAPDELARLKDSLVKEFPRSPLVTISARTGEGVDAWLDFVLAERPAGQTIADVDYDQYADGEAALGWLNAEVQLRARAMVDWSQFAAELLEALRGELQAIAAQIAHVKLRLTADAQSLVGNVTNNDEGPSLRGSIGAASSAVTMLFNARVHLGPEELRRVVQQCLERVAGERLSATIARVESFAPGRPQPVHRFGCVVGE